MATVSLDSPTVVEGAGPVTVTATVDKMVPGGFTIPVSTVLGSAGASDFTGVTGEILTFAGNELGETETFMVTITDDSEEEEAETFGVSLGTAGGFRFYQFSLTSEVATLVPTVNAGSPGTVTINDDDTPGVTISPATPLTVTEGGDQTYTVVLDTMPDSTVMVTIVPDTSMTAPITVDPVSLVLSFDPTEWDTAQTVTVTADQDDDTLGGTRTLMHAVTNYPTVTSAADVTVTINDDDTPGVTISPATPLTVTEGGDQTYTVVLDTMPDSTVMVTIVPDTSMTAPITVDPVSLVLSFDPTEWDTAQTVTVTADQDDDALGGTRTLMHAVTNYPTVTSAADVTVTVNDNDTAGVTITPTTLTVTEGEAGGTYMVVLDTRPDSDVMVTVVPDLSVTPPVTVAPASGTLTFTPETWDTDQSFTVTAIEDDDAIGGTRILGHTVIGYTGLVEENVGSVEVTVSDIDVAEFSIEGGVLVQVTEGTGDVTLTAVLDKAIPTGFEVTISTMGPEAFFLYNAMIGSDYTETTATLTFVGTANERQTLTVPILDDDVDEDVEFFGFGVTMVVPPESELPFVNFGDSSSGQIVIADDDTAGVTISETRLAITEEDAAASYTVVLDSDPDGDVTVTIDPGSSTTAPITIDPASLTLAFDSTNWADSQTVTVTATEDGDAAGGTRTLMHTVTGYGDVATAASVTVVVTDDDTPPPGVTISETDLEVTEGREQTYTVVLDSVPVGNVTVTIAEDASATAPITVTPGEGAPGSGDLIFTPATWDAPQTVTVMATEDVDLVGGTRTLMHTVTGYGDVATAESVTVEVLDNDIPGVTLSETTLTVTEEETAETYEVVLNTMPDSDVTVTIVPDIISTTAPIAVTLGTGAPGSLVLTFTSTTWADPQTVTVAATEDADALDGTRVLAHTVNGYTGVTTVASVMVTVNDNDTAGVTITPTTLTVTEGEAVGTYMVVLDTRPDSDVIVTVVLDLSVTAPVTVAPPSGTLTFTPETWDTDQSFTVTAIEDDDAIGGTRTLGHTVTGYTGLVDANVGSVEVTVSDIDVAEFIIEGGVLVQVTEGTGDVTLTAVLDKAIPTGFEVTISTMGPEAFPLYDAMTGSDYTETTATLTFVGTANERQTLTVPILDDDVDEEGETFGFGVTMVVPPESELPFVNFGSRSSGQIAIADDDTAGVTISETTVAVTEGGEQTYTVVLDSEPAGTVVIGINEDSSTAPPITVSPTSLSFDSTDWETAQTVTVTATEDDDAAGGTRTLEHTVTNYPGVSDADVASVEVTVTDTDTAGVTISETTVAVTEGGEQTYTVVLDSEPAGTVVIGIDADSSTAPPITVSPTSLSFDSTDWETAQTVTVTATEDDDAISGTRTLEHTVANYTGVSDADVASVEVTVTDNDMPGVTISKTTVAVTEGGEQTYTVVLDSEPAGTVVIGIDADSSTAPPITVSPTSLSFDSGLGRLLKPSP